MKAEQLDKISDIVPPSIPIASHDNAVIVVLISLIIILAFLYVSYYRSHKQQLKRLKKQYYQKQINQRQLAFKINNLLKQNLNIIKGSVDKKSYEPLKRQCQIACFSRDGLNEKSMQQLFERVEQWM